jgi:Ca-activated chloride channel family protein
MTFIWPSALLLLIVVVFLAALYVLAQRRRSRYALRYANLSLVREALGRGPG